MTENFKISVIGSGTMGNGIAHVFAQSGFKTFDKWWSESYDNEFDHDKRITMIFLELEKLLSVSGENIHRKMFGDSIEEEEWIKLFNILKHNYLHLPVHAKNQKQKVIDKINNFLEGV